MKGFLVEAVGHLNGLPGTRPFSFMLFDYR